MSLRGVIFDMDGVATDTERLHMIAHSRFLARHGHDVPPEWFARYIGTPTRRNIAEMKERFGLPGAPEALYDERDDILIDIFEHDPLHPLPGFMEALEEVRRRGCAVGLCSSSSRRQIRAIMARLCARLPGEPAIDEVFDAVTDGDEVTHSKPAPDIYRLAASRLGLDTSDCLAIEDSVPGVTAAVDAGCTTVAVPQAEYSEGLDFSRAHYRAASLAELVAKDFYGLLPEAP